MKQAFSVFALLFLNVSLLCSQADLVVSTAGFQPAVTDKGELFSVQATVTNDGNQTADANYLLIYYSQDLFVSDEEVVSRVSIKELAPNESQEIDFIYPVSADLTAGDYYLGFEIDPYNEVPESDEENLFCAADQSGCITFEISNTTLSSLKYTYPVIFIHGLASNSKTWDAFSELAGSLYAWSYGGRLDYCLNPDADQSSSDTDILNYVDASNLRPGDYYTLNFDVTATGMPFPGIFFGTDYSNQSAITKQGWAVRDAIERVLALTGAEKVILAGHSMGGLASRQYIQNPDLWQADGEHHIAKVLTIGTPNGGSNTTGAGLGIFGGLDEFSEAVRDMRHDGFPFLYDAEFLFGGVEDNFSVYHNNDVNCNGFVGDLIIGLNEKVSPPDINYSCIVSPIDGVVDADRADLNTYLLAAPPLAPLFADKFTVSSVHTSIHINNPSTVISGLDEPAFYDLAYAVPLNTLQFGHSTLPAENNPIPPPNDGVDYDTYQVEITENGWLQVDISNIPVHGFALFLVDEDFFTLEVVQALGESNISLEYPLTPGTYYVETGSFPDADSWRYPYAYAIEFEPAEPLVAGFSSNQQEGCLPLTVQFVNQSSGAASNYLWTFPGGTPASSTSENPVVVYNTPGSYPVTLRVTDAFGDQTVTQNGFITVDDAPQAGFSYDSQGATVSFTNQTQYAIEAPAYLWNFGDGNSSTEVSPVHTYQTSGSYTVVLTANNSCGPAVFTQVVTITIVGVEVPTTGSSLTVFPNPGREKLNLTIEGPHTGAYQVDLLNSVGQIVRRRTALKNGSVLQLEMEVQRLPAGSYMVMLSAGGERLAAKFLKW